MIVAYFEPSGESPELAREEGISAAEAVGGTSGPASEGAIPGLVSLRLPDLASVARVAERLALARRTVVPVDPTSVATRAVGRVVGPARVAVRRLGRPSAGGSDPAVLAVGRDLVARGWSIDLDHPTQRLWVAADADGVDRLFEEVGAVDRQAPARRRMPHLPFQRPVSLEPRLGRAAANLARIRPGDRVVDPFLGTGALLAEAGLLGAELWGVDADATMVRGALRNFAHLGLTPRAVVEGDAAEVEFPDAPAEFDAILSDPPYGRASSTGGEGTSRLVARVLPRWADRVRDGGRVAVVLPGGPDPLGAPWRRVVGVAVRVHRSLTREFRVYER